jgi:hypothetical protein
MIQDKETNNYVSSYSVLESPREVAYCTYTGIADGFEYYRTVAKAQEILHNVDKMLKCNSIRKQFVLLKNDVTTIPDGKLVKKYYKK